jgi:transposase
MIARALPEKNESGGIPLRARIRFKISCWRAGQYEMGKPYSEDLRERVIGAAQDGATIPEIAEQFGVSISSVVRFRRLQRETGSVSAAKFGGYKGYALAAHEGLVRELVVEQPDITLAELKAVLATEKVTVGQSSISRFLHHLNLRFKKKPARRRAGPAGRRRRT